MSCITQLSRLSNFMIGGYKSVLQGRTWLTPIQTCTYTRKSAEEKLGLDKPKRPLTPFFKFIQQMRPALLAKNPGISSKEAVTWISKHWQQLDTDTKGQMLKEYEKDSEDYKKIKALYEASLTDKQKEDIKQLKEEMQAAREKRKLKAEFRELGKPRKPMSSYFLFVQTRKEPFTASNIKEYQQKMKAEWLKLSENERVKFEKQAHILMDKYKKDLEVWEMKMISEGRTDLVREVRTRVKKPKEKAQ